MSAPKSDQAIIASRRHRLLELLSEGKTKSQCAEILQSEGYPASPNTLWLDFKGLRSQWEDANMDSIGEYRAAQLIELSELKAQLVSPNIPPVKKVELALAIIDREIDLLGTKAATKTITANINTDVDPEQLVGYRRFVYETSGLTTEQVESVYQFARKMLRPATVEHTPPASSELWDEEGS